MQLQVNSLRNSGFPLVCKMEVIISSVQYDSKIKWHYGNRDVYINIKYTNGACQSPMNLGKDNGQVIISIFKGQAKVTDKCVSKSRCVRPFKSSFTFPSFPSGVFNSAVTYTLFLYFKDNKNADYK